MNEQTQRNLNPVNPALKTELLFCQVFGVFVKIRFSKLLEIYLRDRDRPQKIERIIGKLVHSVKKTRVLL